MATLHPTPGPRIPEHLSQYRELEVLRTLEQGLPTGFDIFHSVHWAVEREQGLQVGEIDIAVVSPAGQVLLLEVKAGEVGLQGERLTKSYLNRAGVSDVGHQSRRMHNGLLTRIHEAGLEGVHIGTLLVMPDQHLTGEVVAYPRERIVDAAQWPEVCSRAMRAFPAGSVGAETRRRLIDFLCNRFELQPDVVTQVQQIQGATVALASGLATWVPQIEHASGVVVVHATAGSGKTQLALGLMRDAAAQGRRLFYCCFNRPLADHMNELRPARAEVGTFHDLCVQHSRRQGLEPAFGQPGVFDQLAAAYAEQAGERVPLWDTLIIDEMQDFDPTWVQALLQGVKEGGQVYLLGDPEQQLYQREAFDIDNAVTVRCRDNFRSPRKVVEFINWLGLTAQPVQARSVFAGQSPGVHRYAPPGTGRGAAPGAVAVVEACVRDLLKEGLALDQIVVLTYGRSQSAVLGSPRLAGHRCRRFTGQYSAAGDPLWDEGELLVDTLYRFKGQSAPVVVLCEIDFAAWGDREARKLLVGMTRAQYRLELVMSEAAEAALLARLQAN